MDEGEVEDLLQVTDRQTNPPAGAAGWELAVAAPAADEEEWGGQGEGGSRRGAQLPLTQLTTWRHLSDKGAVDVAPAGTGSAKLGDWRGPAGAWSEGPGPAANRSGAPVSRSARVRKAKIEADRHGAGWWPGLVSEKCAGGPDVSGPLGSAEANRRIPKWAHRKQRPLPVAGVRLALAGDDGCPRLLSCSL